MTGKELLVLVTGDAGLHPEDNSNNSISNDHSVWLNPRFIGPKGELFLSELQWIYAKVGWGRPLIGIINAGSINAGSKTKPIKYRGKVYPKAIFAHAKSEIIYEVPEGYTTFKATGFLANHNDGGGSVTFSVSTIDK